MYTKISQLFPHYPSHLGLIAGTTQSEQGHYLDFLVDRPEGMNGYMLQLTTLGCGDVFDGQQTFYAKKGQLLLFSPFAKHYYHRNENSPYWHYKWVYFQPNPKYSSYLNWANTQSHIGRFLLEDTHYFLEISQLFSKIELELKSSLVLNVDLGSCLLEYLLMKCVSTEQLNNLPAIDERVLWVCEKILANLANNENIETLARQVYLSASRLSHLFKMALGVGIVQWREQQRILEAKKLLHFSNISVTHLARSLGYEDAFYFSKRFKKQAGLSPSEFRLLVQPKM